MKGIYLELDGIFDTRTSLAMKLDPIEFSKKLKTKEHLYRVKDNFGNLPHDIFIAYYRKRNKMLLKDALLTPLIPEIVMPEVKNIISRDDELINPYPKYYVNTYPYNLVDEEQEYLLKMLMDMLNTEDVELIHLSKFELTTRYVNEHMELLFMYDGLEWLEVQTASGNFHLDPLGDVNLCVPLISNHIINSNQITKEMVNEIVAQYKYLVNLYFIDSRYFTVDIENLQG